MSEATERYAAALFGAAQGDAGPCALPPMP